MREAAVMLPRLVLPADRWWTVDARQAPLPIDEQARALKDWNLRLKRAVRVTKTPAA